MVKKKPLSVYIHIPFCVRKCNYCDFASFPSDAAGMSVYVRALMQELHGYETLASLYQIRTVFFGGGTPSLLPTVQLERILNELRSSFSWDPHPEISMESNPGTLTEEKLCDCRSMGINRLSIGLQSVHNDELKLLGRIHDYDTFLRSYEQAKAAGFDNINVDLMSSLPYQTAEKWESSLRTVAELKPAHISAYSLSIEEGTPFYDQFGQLPGSVALPTEEADREMYRSTRRILEEYGYHRYEFSNYAQPGRECRHNLAYWTGGEYIGVGLSGASYLAHRRYTNPKQLQEYLAEARHAYENSKKTAPLSRKEEMEEFMFLGLRTMRGISRQEFRSRFGESFPGCYEKTLLDLYNKGYITKLNDRFALTEDGIDVSNVILAEFLMD